MLVKLSGRALTPLREVSDAPFVGRITEQIDGPRGTHDIFLTRIPVALADGFRAYLIAHQAPTTGPNDSYRLGSDWHYLGEGDIVRIDPIRRSVHALYRRSSPSNSFLVTERCDNYCVMCSQPPREVDDSWLLDELHELIPLIALETRELGITGGEPALLGQRLVGLIAALGRQLPATAIHVLTNGRRFVDPEFARALGKVRHPDLMLGIPLYADAPEEHDFVVQAKGAFEETIRGILNLKRAGVRVELRFVIHRETCAHLPAFAQFVSRNLRFVDHVALMGLELMGFARTNLDSLWIDPLDYSQELVSAVRTLRRAGMNTSIYNHQLCVLPTELHEVARRSISDWKQRHFDECGGCTRRDQCGGFFASAELRRSRGITPFA